MCFSVNVNVVKEELENRYGATLIDPDKYRPSYYYHAFAIPEMPVLCSGDPSNIKLYTWGLIPERTKDMNEAMDIRSKTFNARSESLDQKPAFAGSFHSRRCIIPVKGFFEWQHVGKDKIPWYIYHRDGDILSLAGLFDHWIDKSTGNIYNTFSVITTPANDLLAEIHNSGKRMPAILERSEERMWLNPDASETEVKSLLRPAPPDKFGSHTIGPLINKRNADKNDPEVIRPSGFYQQNLLF